MVGLKTYSRLFRTVQLGGDRFSLDQVSLDQQLTMDDSWRTPQMRQSVVSKLNDAIQASPGASKSAIEMENHVFQKAKTKDEYLGFVARLILHVREMNTKKQPQAGEGNPDPINALQNLANQGSRPPNVMGGGMAQGGVVGNNPNMGQQQPNLMQTLTQQRNQPGMNNPQQQQQQQQQAGPSMQQNRGAMQGNMMGGGGVMNQGMNPGGMGNVMNPMVQGQMMGGGPNQVGAGGGGMPMSQMPMNNQQMGAGTGQMNQMGPGGMNQMNPGMVNMQGMGPGQMVQMNPGNNVPVGPGMNAGPAGPMNQGMVGGVNQMNMINQMQMSGRKPEMMMNNPGNMFTSTVRSVTPNQFMRENPSPSVPSPHGAGMANPGQMIPSPALAQSPSPQMMNVNQRNMANVMAPSPGSSLNTPGQPGAIPSPMNPQEEELYKEKYRQLVKYIEPLQRMTAKMMSEKNTHAIKKINTLLEILSNSTQRIPLATLYKCERALEQMNIPTSGSGSGGTKESSSSNPLIEAVTANLQSPIRNHTLQRTFKPCLDALFGTDLSDMPSPPKQHRMSQENHPPGTTTQQQQEIPHILQGEIARLDQKFKINLDSSCQTGHKTIKLICSLDDKYLPCVPPISVTIPEEYPTVSPSCNLTEHEYNATPFLTSVQTAFTARVAKLPRIFSLTHLLDTWEMSVRQACSPKKLNENSHTQLSVMLGV